MYFVMCDLGTVAYRDLLKGSWFIQEFCKNALSYGKLEDVTGLVARTTKCIANLYYHTENGKITKQIPTSLSTLTRRFYLTNSKYRQLLLKGLQQQDEIIENLRELNENK